MPGLAADLISYDDLYSRWERGNWSATELDFTQDKEDWAALSDLEREALLWNFRLFFWGEDAVADNLSPYIDAAPRQEQKYFLTTQQVDEARHAVFFKRFMHEVAGIGHGDMASGLAAIRPQLTWGFMQIFDRLDTMADELRKDRSRPKFAAAIALYHFVIEASLAQPGQHMIERALQERSILPGFRAGIANVALDEQRHIGFGVKLMADLVREDPRCRESVADLLREVIPWTSGVLTPPNGDRTYTEALGFTLEEIGAYGADSLTTKFRAAGLPIEEMPGPPPLLPGLTHEEQAARGYALYTAGIVGPENGPVSSDRETAGVLFDTIRRSINPDHGLTKPTVLQWDFPDAEPWYIRIDNGSTSAEPGRHATPDVTFKLSYQDWAGLVGGRRDPRRLFLTGKLRARGRLRTLAKLPKILPAR